MTSFHALGSLIPSQCVVFCGRGIALGIAVFYNKLVGFPARFPASGAKTGHMERQRRRKSRSTQTALAAFAGPRPFGRTEHRKCTSRKRQKSWWFDCFHRCPVAMGKGASFFGWLSLKGNPAQKREEKRGGIHWTTGKLYRARLKQHFNVMRRKLTQRPAECRTQLVTTKPRQMTCESSQPQATSKAVPKHGKPLSIEESSRLDSFLLRFQVGHEFYLGTLWWTSCGVLCPPTTFQGVPDLNSWPVGLEGRITCFSRSSPCLKRRSGAAGVVSLLPARLFIRTAPTRGWAGQMVKRPQLESLGPAPKEQSAVRRTTNHMLARNCNPHQAPALPTPNKATRAPRAKDWMRLLELLFGGLLLRFVLELLRSYRSVHAAASVWHFPMVRVKPSLRLTCFKTLGLAWAGAPTVRGGDGCMRTTMQMEAS